MRSLVTMVGKGAGPVSLSRTEATLPTISDLKDLAGKYHQLKIRCEELRVGRDELLVEYRKLQAENKRLEEESNNSKYWKKQLEAVDRVRQELFDVTKGLTRMKNSMKKAGKVKRMTPRVKVAEIFLRVSPEMKEQLRTLAFGRKESLNHMVIQILKDFLDNQ